MITKLSIANFKSIRQLDVECKKINLFIGEPNTGKSNILEALALLSWCGHPVDEPLCDYVRFQTIPNLFYDQLLDDEVVVAALTSEKPNGGMSVAVKSEGAEFLFHEKGNRMRSLTYEGHPVQSPSLVRSKMPIKFFRFKKLDRYDGNKSEGLVPPNGANLFSVVVSSKTLREIMAEFFRKYGLRLVMKPFERAFELQKQVDDLVFSYPYALTSDTLQRIIFYTIAMASNKDSVLVFEEPESNAFPYYTKYLGERIARDETNQFFIATHNPYLLSAIIEKGRKEDVQVFITYFKDYQTKVRPLTPDEVVELMEADPFFNLDRFIEDGQ
jgi:hypothetical protein